MHSTHALNLGGLNAILGLLDPTCSLSKELSIIIFSFGTNLKKLVKTQPRKCQKYKRSKKTRQIPSTFFKYCFDLTSFSFVFTNRKYTVKITTVQILWQMQTKSEKFRQNGKYTKIKMSKNRLKSSFIHIQIESKYSISISKFCFGFSTS